MAGDVSPYGMQLEAWLSAHLDQIWPPVQGLTAAQLEGLVQTTRHQERLGEEVQHGRQCAGARHGHD